MTGDQRMREHRRHYSQRRNAQKAVTQQPGGRDRLHALRRVSTRSRPPANPTYRRYPPMLRMTPRGLAITGMVVLFLVLVVVAADAKGADRVDRMSQSTLERTAIRAAATGGVRSTRYGDASPYLKRLSRELVERAFPPRARPMAFCLVGRESGWNPGAISSTDDHGLAQINRPSHPQFSYMRMNVDPPYSVMAFVRLSNHGRDWGPWGWAC